MRINLTTEGTYPHYYGGVSVWADQLVTGMTEHDFEVVAMVGQGDETQVWPYPDNARHRQTVALWPRQGRHVRIPRAVRDQFSDAWEVLVQAFVGGEPPVEELDSAWRELCTPAIGRHAWSLAVGSATTRATVAAFARAGREGWVPKTVAQPTLAEVLTMLDHVSASLRALQVDPVEADLSHAVSNGLSVLPCLISYWAHGVPFLVSEHGVYLRERLLALGTSDSGIASRVLLEGLGREITTLAYRHASLLAPGNLYNRRWQEELGAPPERIRTTYNGVDTAQFAPSPESEQPTLVFAGRMDPIKDIETFLRACALVREQVRDVAVRIFGPTPQGNEDYRQRCVDLSSSLGLDDIVTFEGSIDWIGDAYQAAQIVVLSSISEGFPYTVLEAMCSGRPVVATDVGGTAEATGHTGLIVPPKDPQALANACVTLLLDTDLRQRLGQEARERVVSRFSWVTSLATMREVYLEAAGQGERPSGRTPNDVELPRPAAMAGNTLPEPPESEPPTAVSVA